MKIKAEQGWKLRQDRDINEGRRGMKMKAEGDENEGWDLIMFPGLIMKIRISWSLEPRNHSNHQRNVNNIIYNRIYRYLHKPYSIITCIPERGRGVLII